MSLINGLILRDLNYKGTVLYLFFECFKLEVRNFI